MRILIRVMGFCCVGIIFIMLFMHYASLNTRIEELNIISSLAMNQTQLVMAEQIEDHLYDTHNAREKFDSNQEYLNYFIENLKPLIATDSSYSVDLLNVDYTKGLLDVRVNCNYRLLNGKTKTLSTRKTGIVDILMDDSEVSTLKTYNVTGQFSLRVADCPYAVKIYQILNDGQLFCIDTYTGLDAFGSFKFNKLNSGRYIVKAEIEGYESSSVEFEIEDRSINGLVIELKKNMFDLKGNAYYKDRSGNRQNCVFCKVEVVDEKQNVTHRAQTDETGKYYISKVLNGSYSLNLYHDDDRYYETFSINNQDLNLDVTIPYFKKEYQVSGTLFNWKGEALQDIEIMLDVVDEQDAVLTLKVKSDENGRYQFTNIPEYSTLEIKIAGNSSYYLPTKKTITSSLDSNIEKCDFVIENRFIEMQGFVYEDDIAFPAAKMDVKLFKNDDLILTKTTDANGLFSIELKDEINFGTYQLQIIKGSKTFELEFTIDYANQSTFQNLECILKENWIFTNTKISKRAASSSGGWNEWYKWGSGWIALEKPIKNFTGYVYLYTRDTSASNARAYVKYADGTTEMVGHISGGYHGSNESWSGRVNFTKENDKEVIAYSIDVEHKKFSGSSEGEIAFTTYYQKGR